MVQLVKRSPPISEDCGSNPGAYLGKLVTSFQYPVVYCAESSPTGMYWFPLPALKTTRFGLSYIMS